jgi:hypothetical protein
MHQDETKRPQGLKPTSAVNAYAALKRRSSTGAARILNFPQALEVVPVAISILKPQLAPQRANDGGDVVFLEEADGGDSGGTSFEAESGILNVHSAEG